MCGRYTVNTEAEIIEMREILQEISRRLMRDETKSEAAALLREYISSSVYSPIKNTAVGAHQLTLFDGKTVQNENGGFEAYPHQKFR